MQESHRVSSDGKAGDGTQINLLTFHEKCRGSTVFDAESIVRCTRMKIIE